MSGPTIQAADSNQTQTLRAPDERIYPARFRWLKRSLLLSLMLLLVLGGLRAWWGHEAQRRVNAFVAAARARGEPVLEEDFKLPPIPDEENAAVPIGKALDQLILTRQEEEFERNANLTQSLGDDDLAEIGKMLAAHQTEMDLVRNARTRPRMQWEPQFAHPIAMTPLPHLEQERLLSRLFMRAALYDHAKGQDAQALNDIGDIFLIARATYHDTPGIITYYVGAGIDGLAISCVNEIASTLDVGSEHPSAENSSASRDQGDDRATA